MNRHQFLASSVLALCAASAPAAGQRPVEPPDHPSVFSSEGPTYYATYDYATKEVAVLDEPPPASGAEAAGISFDNTALTIGGFAVTGFSGEELVDWGVKSGGLTGVVSTVEICYTTDDVFPVSLDVALYSGTLGSCDNGDPGVEVERLVLTGLPGDVTGGFMTSYILRIDVAEDPIILPDGPIGWGYVNPMTTGNSNGPRLVVVGATPTGTANNLDSYSPAPATGPATCFSTGAIADYGSTYLRLEEEDGTEPPEQEIDNGSGVNPMLVGLGSTPPAIGSTWDPAFLPGLPGTTLLEVLALSTAKFPDGTILPGFGELLIDITPPNPFLTVAKPPGGPFLIPIPLNVNLVGFEVFTQSVRLFTNPSPPGPPLISAGNRADVTIGL